MQYLNKCLLLILCCVNEVILYEFGTGKNGNLRVCVVEGQGSAYKRASKFCQMLDEDDNLSKIECVLGTDRLDCLRRISKGRADFGVFTAEELVAALWAKAEVLAVAQVRTKASEEYARNVVALVNKKTWERKLKEVEPFSTKMALRNLTLCAPVTEPDDIHPLSDTIESYMESMLTRPSCDPNLTVTENKVRAIAQFFGAACRAGAWVSDKTWDAELKKKYPSLCSACSTGTCSRFDKYWGEAGALNCVLEGAGDLAFLERDDVIQYFQNKSSGDFAYLCNSYNGVMESIAAVDGKGDEIPNKYRDGYNRFPCTWVTKPWPVIIARRKSFEAVRELLAPFLDASAIVNQRWQGALAQLLDLRGAITYLEPPQTPEDYLSRADGFQEAYSQHGCVPSRHITICTTSLLENNKCEWFAEAGAVYGVIPPIQCSRRNSTEECFQAICQGASDVIVESSDWLVPAARVYNITPILHEATPIIEKMHTIFAYVRKDSNITKMEDLRGKRAYFPRFEGIAIHSVARYLKNVSKGGSCTTLSKYFSDICVARVENTKASKILTGKFTESCLRDKKYQKDAMDGEKEALRAVVENKSDVAFISMNTYNMYKANQYDEFDNDVELTHICPDENPHYCFITWANIGHIYSASNQTKMRRNEIITTFTKLDKLFGQHKNSHMFSMYGPYSYRLNVLFHNNTKYLDTDDMYSKRPYRELPFSFEITDYSEFCSIEDLGNAAVEKFQQFFISVICLYLTLVIF